MATKTQLLAWEEGDDIDLAGEPLAYFVKQEESNEESGKDQEASNNTPSPNSSPTSVIDDDDDSAAPPLLGNPPLAGDDDPPTSLKKLRIGQGFVLSAHKRRVAKVSQSTLNIIKPFEAFAKVVVKYTNMPVFNTVRTYDDLDGLDYVLCEDTSAAVVYADFLKLPPPEDRNGLPNSLLLLLIAIFATYIGMSGQADRRAGQHRRGPRVAPNRLFYLFLAIALDHKMVGVLVVPEEEQFETDFYDAYGKQGDFARGWSARELLVAFLSSFEAVYIASDFAYRGDDDYLAHLEAYSGCSAPNDIIGLNSTDGCANFLACYQGQQRARAAKGGGVQVLPAPSREFVLERAVDALTTSGCSAFVSLDAGEHFGNLYLPSIFLETTTVLRLSAQELATLGLDQHPRPSRPPVLVRLERRDASEPFVFMGSIDDARFFTKWSIVVDYEGRTLELSWGRGGSFCPTTASKLANVLLKSQPSVEQAELADLPVPDFVALEDLVLNPTLAAAEWKRPRRMQAETSIQGSLARSVSACSASPAFYIISLIDANNNNRNVKLPADELGRLPATLYAVVCVSPTTGTIRYAYKDRNDHSPVKPNEWHIYKGPRCGPLQSLVNDACDLRSLDEVDDWDSTSTGYWPLHVVARRLRAGRYPVARDARPFGHTMKPPTSLGFAGTKKEPVFLEVILKDEEEEEEDEMWWIDSRTGERVPHKLNRRGGNPGRDVVNDLRKYERGELDDRSSKKARR